MTIISEITPHKMQEYMKDSPINSQISFEETYKGYPVEAFSIKTVPYLELGKAYHFEIYNYNKPIGWLYVTWLCIPIKFPNKFGQNIVFKILATDYDEARSGAGSLDYEDIKYETFSFLQSYKNVHEITCEDFPLYLNLDYKSPMFYDSIKEGIPIWKKNSTQRKLIHAC